MCLSYFISKCYQKFVLDKINNASVCLSHLCFWPPENYADLSFQKKKYWAGCYAHFREKYVIFNLMINFNLNFFPPKKNATIYLTISVLGLSLAPNL